MSQDVASALRVANLVIEDLAEENAALYEHLNRAAIARQVDQQMVSILLEMLWRMNVIAEPHGALLAETEC